jgi:predicted ATP-grasp superfamily ATP-dependent carboligase
MCLCQKRLWCSRWQTCKVPEIRFPVVVKDRFSARWLGKRAVLGSVTYAYSQDDLRQKVEQRLGEAGDVLVQEFVAGTGIGFASLAVDETPHLPFQWLRIREVDPRASGSSARKSVPVTHEFFEFSRALITRIGFQGISMVEFKAAWQRPCGSDGD